jgi:hypothetical protein
MKRLRWAKWATEPSFLWASIAIVVLLVVAFAWGFHQGLEAGKQYFV